MRWATRNPTIPTCKARPDSRYSSAPNKRCTLATHSMKSIYSIGEVEQLVKQGHSLVIAGEEEYLRLLSPGNWIGAVANRYLGTGADEIEPGMLFAFDLSEHLLTSRVCVYQSFNLDGLQRDCYGHGFSVVLMPAFSEVHRFYGIYSATLGYRYLNPVIGWVAGANLGTADMLEPLVIDGLTGRIYPDRAVVLHCLLKSDIDAKMQVINIFEPGDGDSMVFPEASFIARSCYVNGKLANLVDYWHEVDPNPQLPLVASIGGALVNVMPLQPVGHNSITMCSALIPGVEYRFAKPPEQMAAQLHRRVNELAENTILLTCCELLRPYLNSSTLQRTDLQAIYAPGETAYSLQNFTMVGLSLHQR